MAINKNQLVGSRGEQRSALFQGDENCLGKYHSGTGHGWCSKRHHKKTKGHQTPGQTKGEKCKADYLKRHMAKCSRSYKHPNYGTWLEKVREMNS